MLGDARFQVVRNKARDAAAVEFGHADMARRPRVLLHVKRRLDVVIAAVRQRSCEQVGLRDFAGCRIDDGHGGTRLVDLYRASRLALDARRQVPGHDTAVVLAAERRVRHVHAASAHACVRVLGMQEKQGRADAAELLAHVVPVGLLEDALDTEPPGKDRAAGLVVVLVGNAVVSDSQLVGTIEYRTDALLRHSAASCDRAAREPRSSQPRYRLRLDLGCRIVLLSSLRTRRQGLR